MGVSLLSQTGDQNGNLERFDARHLLGQAGHGSGDAHAAKAIAAAKTASVNP